VYFHGGGWVLGGLDSDDPFCRDLCVRADALGVSVDYRADKRHEGGILPFWRTIRASAASTSPPPFRNERQSRCIRRRRQFVMHRRHGQDSGIPPPGSQAPTATAKPRPCASATAVSTRRDFPTPGSPPRRTTPSPPAPRVREAGVQDAELGFAPDEGTSIMLDAHVLVA
jgi:alpha/beta hydrolase fold